MKLFMFLILLALIFSILPILLSILKILLIVLGIGALLWLLSFIVKKMTNDDVENNDKLEIVSNDIVANNESSLHEKPNKIQNKNVQDDKNNDLMFGNKKKKEELGTNKFKNNEKNNTLNKDIKEKDSTNILILEQKNKDINNLTELLNKNNSYKIEHNRGKIIIYQNRLEIFKEYSELPFIVKYDAKKMNEFNLGEFELICRDDECKLTIKCSKINEPFATDVEIMIFNTDKKEELYRVAEFLKNKFEIREKYIKEFGNEIKISEEERIYGKNRFSNKKFEQTLEKKILKACYYNVEVQGVKYRNFDISQIPIDEEVVFEFEPTNEYDKNAIKIWCKDNFIGYVPKREIQKIIKKYIKNEDKHIVAFVSKVDEEQQRIYIATGMYDVVDENLTLSENYYDFKLIRTTRRDRNFEGTSRQDNLLLVNENDDVYIDYDHDLETYVVEFGGMEIGEIGRPDSKELFGYQSVGKQFKSKIIKLEKQDEKIFCTIRVYVI